MDALTARRGRLALSLGVGLPAAGFVVALLGLAGRLPWAEAAALGLPLTLVLLPVARSAAFVARAAPLGETARAAAILTVAALLSAALWVALAQGLAAALGRLDRFAGVGSRLTPATPLLFGLGVLLYLLAAAGHYLGQAVADSRRAERRALEARLAAREAELRALRAQVDPHFLFNSLNAIAALAGSDPAAARRTAALLAEFFRRCLRSSEAGAIPLADELALARDYLAIEAVRFGDRLRAAGAVAATGSSPGPEEPAGDATVPPLLLQPLIENAVRHGVAGLVEGGTVAVEIHRRGERLRLSVVNDVDPEAAGAGGEGMGLELVRRRLAAAYGEAAQLRAGIEEGRFRVDLDLPARPDRGA